MHDLHVDSNIMLIREKFTDSMTNATNNYFAKIFRFFIKRTDVKIFQTFVKIELEKSPTSARKGSGTHTHTIKNLIEKCKELKIQLY